MNTFKTLTASRVALLLVGGVLGLGLGWPLAGTAQDKAADQAKHKHGDAVVADKSLADQVRELQAKVTKLEAALKQSHPGTSAGSGGMGGMMGGGMMGGPGTGGPGMGMMGSGMMGGPGMGMMGGSGMGGMQGKGTGGTPGMGGVHVNVQESESVSMMGMMSMGSMGPDSMKAMTGMGKMQMTAALPGFPGASHIYHIGATGFFLDHPEHVTLTTKQQTALNGLKEKALLEKSTFQRKIDEAEQELWTLTASDQPDAAKIEVKVKEIEKLRGDQRLAFIRAVGEAAKVLTDEQRKALLGQAADKADKTDKHSH
jgi:Spy/CpxP family protein refolding chaperone